MIKLNGFEVDNFRPPYVIAEIGSNHNGDIKLAKKLIDSAKTAGCHSAKFQSWTKLSIFSRQVYDDNYFLADDYRDRTDYTLEEIVDAYSTSENELRDLKSYCDDVGIVFSCTPFSESEVDFLVDELKVSFLKLASMDCNNYPFLEYVAAKNLPTILSTGLSAIHEIDQAVEIFETQNNKSLILLHCVAQYPPAPENINLNNIEMLRNSYPEYPVGFSDHTLGTNIPIAAIAKGACLIEKHFTLDKNMKGWDHAVSATQDEMAQIVKAGEEIPTAHGNYRRVVTAADVKSRTAFRRSIVASRNINAGQIIKRSDLDLKRPGTGILPEKLNDIIGKTAKTNILFDQLLSPDDF